MERTLVAFGISSNFYSLMERLDKVCDFTVFCDNNCHKWGQHIMGDERICINPQLLTSLKNPFILITAGRESSIQEIEEQCNQYQLPYQRAYDFLEEIELKPSECHWPQLIQRRRIHKFIELLVYGTTECNFHCEYCYVWRRKEFKQGRVTSEYTPKEIRAALSQKKLGGPCHINACALGETLLSKDIVALVYELLDEGHYLSIITNGTILPKIEAILQFPDNLLERMFFKLSFHYAELKRTNLMDIFWKNVEMIKNSPCSYTIEITPCDTLIDEIDTIKEEFRKRADGAMPHITFTRDGNKKGLDLLSDLSLEEYKNIWGTFDSDLFDLKCNLYKKKIHHTCYAGCWSYRINAVDGNLQSCYRQRINGTIFSKNQKVLPILTVGKNCCLDYCFNNHAFLTWGNVPDISCENYYKVRDRVSSSSVHWVKDTYASAMQQKLHDNNFEYINRWPDYEKLFAINRKPAFILFNSPDYANLGDHAIALAERRLFRKLFSEIEFIEISCEQYIKENLLIQNVIQDEDILIISGGGYLGSLWLWLEDIVKNIVQKFINNKIIIFPQTLYFEDSSLGMCEKKSLSNVFNSHSDLTVILRERSSYQLAIDLFSTSVKKLLIPDIVLSLEYKNAVSRTGGLICIRGDKESKGIDSAYIKYILQRKGFTSEYFSTISDEEVCLKNRENNIMKTLDKISAANIVITDRLHAMLFCTITNTPCVAFDNITGKVSETYRWLEKCPHIILCKREEDLEGCIEKALDGVKRLSVVDINDITNNISRKFKELEEYLKENCFV